MTRRDVPVLAVVIGAVAVAFIGGVVWASDPRPAMRRTLREIRALPELGRSTRPERTR